MTQKGRGKVTVVAIRQHIVGTAEKEVLVQLERRNGRWEIGDTALCENRYWTLRLLGQLARKGLVQEIKPEQEFMILPAGSKMAKPFIRQAW